MQRLLLFNTLLDYYWLIFAGSYRPHVGRVMNEQRGYVDLLGGLINLWTGLNKQKKPLLNSSNALKPYL